MRTRRSSATRGREDISPLGFDGCHHAHFCGRPSGNLVGTEMSCTCILAKPAGAMGLSTLHGALCMQHGAAGCPEVGKPVEYNPAGLFFAKWDASRALQSVMTASLPAFAKSFTRQPATAM